MAADDADLYRLFEITSPAFDDEDWWCATWPKHWTEAGRVAGAQRFKKIKHTDPNTCYVKAIDQQDGFIVGMAKWNIFVDTIPNLMEPDGKLEDEWFEDTDAKAYQDFISFHFFSSRRDAITMSKGNIVCLDILAVEPIYQKKGIGSAMVAWGTAKADELGLECVVEASQDGRRLYEKYGFIFVKDVVVKVPKRWAPRRDTDYAWLVRPSKCDLSQRGIPSVLGMSV